LSSSLHSKGFNINEEINNEMDGTPKVEFDGYNYDGSNDPTSEGTFIITLFYSMSEGTNEDGYGEQQKEQNNDGNKRRNSCIPSKGRFA
jgi:hypothetical protein